MPAKVTPAWAGVKRLVWVSFLGLVPLFAVGATLETFTEGSRRFGERIADVIGTVVVTTLLGAVDITVAFLVSAMSFAQAGILGPANAWKWAGVAVVAIAFLIGGRTAAATARPATKAQAVVSTLPIGVLLSGVFVVLTINIASLGGVGGFAAPAILLPLPWTAIAALGGWIWANERDLPAGVVFQAAPRQEGSAVGNDHGQGPEASPGSRQRSSTTAAEPSRIDGDSDEL